MKDLDIVDEEKGINFMEINKVVLNQRFENKDDALKYISLTFKEIGIVTDEARFLNALYEREKATATGLVDGFAIPHGICESVVSPGVLYIRNETGLEWGSLDGEPTRDIVAFAITNSSDHLGNLVEISKKLMNSEFVSKLRTSQTEEDVHELFKANS